MLKVVGIVHSVGDYNGFAYDNYNLHCIRPADEKKENELGEITEVVKVKSALFKELSVDVGSDIKVFYDRFGRIDSIIES